jgi:hypothetical protein
MKERMNMIAARFLARLAEQAVVRLYVQQPRRNCLQIVMRCGTDRHGIGHDAPRSYHRMVHEQYDMLVSAYRQSHWNR